MAKDNDAVMNMLFYMSWEARLRPHIPGDHNVFQMTGNPLIVFNRQYFFGLYSGLEGDCLLPGDSQYNSNDGKMSLLYSYDDFINDPICSKIAQPERLGFVSTYDFDFFRTKVDISSLVTCVAVNMGILSYDELDVIEGSTHTGTYPGSNSTLTLSQRFDFRFPGKCNRVWQILKPILDCLPVHVAISAASGGCFNLDYEYESGVVAGSDC
jgi:hypothetical protein